MRRWMRFSLRTLLVLVTALAVWLGWHVNGARRQAAAVKQWRELGGDVFYDFQYTEDPFADVPQSPVYSWLLDTAGVDFFHRVEQAIASREPWDVTELRLADDCLVDLPHLKRLHLVSADNKTLRVVGTTHRQLRTITLGGWLPGFRVEAGVDERGLAHLASLPELRSLDLYADVGDKELAQIAKLPALKSLRIQMAPRVTASGIAALRTKPTLTWLDVNGTEITLAETLRK